MNLQPVSYKILYNSKDITRDISDHLISLSYVDKVQGESDEIELEVEDKDGLWQNEWYPQKGDTIEVQIIDVDAVLPCGKFTLDEKKLSSGRGDGDLFQISGVASSITKKLRTKKSSAHENKTLKQLAQFVAQQHGLKIEGTIPNIRFNRITQNRETDLRFLSRIADSYGLIFSVRDDKLVFQEMKEIEGKAHVISLDKTDVISFEFTDKTEDTYKDAKVKYHNPENNELVQSESAGGDGFDTLEIKERAENSQQAELKASASLRKKNTQVLTGSIVCPGNLFLVSGNNVELTGFGNMSGVYHITESSHELNRSDGYVTSFEVKKVNVVLPAKYKPKRKKIPKPQNVRLVSLNGVAAADGVDTIPLRSRNFVPQRFAD